MSAPIRRPKWLVGATIRDPFEIMRTENRLGTGARVIVDHMEQPVAIVFAPAPANGGLPFRANLIAAAPTLFRAGTFVAGKYQGGAMPFHIAESPVMHELCHAIIPLEKLDNRESVL